MLLDTITHQVDQNDNFIMTHLCYILELCLWSCTGWFSHQTQFLRHTSSQSRSRPRTWDSPDTARTGHNSGDEAPCLILSSLQQNKSSPYPGHQCLQCHQSGGVTHELCDQYLAQVCQDSQCSDRFLFQYQFQASLTVYPDHTHSNSAWKYLIETENYLTWNVVSPGCCGGGIHDQHAAPLEPHVTALFVAWPSSVLVSAAEVVPGTVSYNILTFNWISAYNTWLFCKSFTDEWKLFSNN